MRLFHAMTAGLPGFPRPGDVDIAVHRVVHTGELQSDMMRATNEVRQAVANAAPLAPEHNALSLAGIETVERCLPDVEQFIISDSAYHASIPAAAATYAVPHAWHAVWGIRKLGFHGISHGYAAQRVARLTHAALASLKLVSCHLGNGCSLAAISGGGSVDTTMGWTPVDGLVMGQRSGSVDPGIILYLLERGRYTAHELTKVLNEESGLKGISGLSGDMGEILESASVGHPLAKLAFDVYIHRLRCAIGAMAASMDGVDAIAFTGGVGENVPAVRREVCRGLGFLGVRLDDVRNLAPGALDADISEPNSAVRVLVVHARETWALARQCALLRSRAHRVAV
jgi:acetate kinase